MSKMAKAQSGHLEIVCTICIDDLVEHNGSNIIVTECGHPYHDSCLRKWLDQAPPCNDPKKMRLAGNCPVCSTTIRVSELRPLFLTTDTKLSQTVSLEQFNKLKKKYTKLKKEHNRCASKVGKVLTKTVPNANPGRASLTSLPSPAPSPVSLRRITRSMGQQPRLSEPPNPNPSRSAKATVSTRRKLAVARIPKPLASSNLRTTRSVPAAKKTVRFLDLPN